MIGREVLRYGFFQVLETRAVAAVRDQTRRMEVGWRRQPTCASEWFCKWAAPPRQVSVGAGGVPIPPPDQTMSATEGAVPPPHSSGACMKRLSDSETELLISLVQRKPCLWNENHPDFKNTPLRRRLWRAVAGNLHITGDEAKCKWKNLKDKFRKLRHVQEEKSAAGLAMSEPRWRFYNALLFTRDDIAAADYVNGSIIKTEVESDVGVSGDSNASSSFASEIDVDFEIEVPSADKSSSRELVPMSSSSMQQNQRDRDVQISSNKGTKRKKSNISELGRTGEEEVRSGPSRSQDESKGDSDYHFLMSLLPFMEVLEPVDKLELRFGIQRLVAESFKKHLPKKGSRTRQPPTLKQNEY